jgi:hypothetical protein
MGDPPPWWGGGSSPFALIDSLHVGREPIRDRPGYFHGHISVGGGGGVGLRQMLRQEYNYPSIYQVVYEYTFLYMMTYLGTFMPNDFYKYTYNIYFLTLQFPLGSKKWEQIYPP